MSATDSNHRQPATILVADDDPAFNKFISRMLTRDGHRVLNAFNGQEAIDLFQRHPIDVVILDQQMPNMDGITALNRMRQLDVSIAVIMITGYGNHHMLENIKNIANVIDCIFKPFEADELKRAIYRALKRDFHPPTGDIQNHIDHLEHELHTKTIALRSSQIDYKAILENSMDLILIVQHDLVQFANRRSAHVLSCDLEHLHDHPVTDFIHPEDHSLFLSWFTLCLNNPTDAVIHNMRMIKSNGAPILVQMSYQQLVWNGDMAVLCIARDISARDRVETALETRLQYEKLLNEITKRALQCTDVQTLKQETVDILGPALNVSRIFIFEYSKQLKTYTNTVEWTADEVASERALNQGIPEKSIIGWAKNLESGQIVNLLDAEREPDERLKKLFRSRGIKSILAVPLIYEANFLGFIGVDERRYNRVWQMENITLLKTVANILTGSIVRWQTKELMRIKDAALDSSINGVALATPDGKLFYINRAFLQLWNPNDERSLLNTPVSELWASSEDANRVLSQLRLNGNWVGEISARRDDGSIFVAQLAAAVVRQDQYRPICIIFSFIDISSQKQMEEAVLRSAKLSSLGQMAAGLAHELRNPLAVISSCAQFCIDMVKLDRILKENFQVIFRNSQRANHLIKDLLNFARPPEFQWQAVDINPIIRHMLKMARLEKATSRIRFVKNFQNDLPTIEGDEDKLGQVILNLIQNAVHAIKGNGTVTVSSSFDSRQKHIRVAIKDTGPGIPYDYRHRIFDPFFTTKDRGTGLGLSICHTLVQQHGGNIFVTCPETGGTEMAVVLPVKDVFQ